MSCVTEITVLTCSERRYILMDNHKFVCVCKQQEYFGPQVDKRLSDKS